MASPENIRLHISVNGGAPQTGAVEVEPGDVIALSLNNTSGVQRAVYRIWECPEDFSSPPAGWTAESIGYSVTTTNGAPAPMFTMPSHWGKYLLSVEVNDRRRSGKIAQDLFDNSSLVYIESLSGVKDICNGETTQADPIRGYAGELKRTLRTIDEALIAPAEVDLPIQAPHDSVILQGIHSGTGEPIDLVYWGQNADESENTLIISNNSGYVEIKSGGDKAAEFSTTRAWINSSLHQPAQSSIANRSSGEGIWWSYNYGGGVGVLPRFSNANSTYDLGPVERLTSSSNQNNSLGGSHFGRFSRFSHASAKLLVQHDSAVNFPVGAVFNCQYTGSGSLTVQEDTGVTVTPSPAGMSRVVQPGGCFALRKVGDNTWILLGALQAAE